jgi:uncharacterized phage protein (TIGR01671 family)
MREILFRGKSVEQRNSGRWIEGSLVTLDDTHTFIVPRFESASTLSNDFIVSSTMEAVDPSTVGQYTGLNDRNGKRIFEGDVIKIPWRDGYQNRVAIFENGLFKARSKPDSYSVSLVSFVGFDDPELCCEVIGNIHDNPELLEVNK